MDCDAAAWTVGLAKYRGLGGNLVKPSSLSAGSMDRTQVSPPRTLSSPGVFLWRMSVFVVLVAQVAVLLHRQLWDALLTNPGLNSIMCVSLAFGILFAFRQVTRLRPEIGWANAFRIADPGSPNPHRPVLLAPMATLLRDRSRSFLAASLRANLRSTRSRIDEARDIGRYLSALLLLLGVIGASWRIVVDTQAGERNLEAAFAPALLGASGWLVLGFLQLQASQAHNRFYNELEEWLSASTGLDLGGPSKRKRWSMLSGSTEQVQGRPEAEPRGSRIFISYRRSDTRHIAGRIYDRLVAEFSPDDVFFDVDTIPVGVNFKEHIAGFMETSCLVLIVIGETWVNKVWRNQRSWLRSVDGSEDFVQSEVELALDLGVPLLPILVDGVTMPEPKLLPTSIVEVSNLNAASVRLGRDFHADMDAVMARIRPLREKGLQTKTV